MSKHKDGERVQKSTDIKRMGVKEFRERGLLHEVNRRILHPLGLALEVVGEQDGSFRFGEVWDFRDAKGGMVFDELDKSSIIKVGMMEKQSAEARKEKYGFWIQEGDLVGDGVVKQDG